MVMSWTDDQSELNESLATRLELPQESAIKVDSEDNFSSKYLTKEAKDSLAKKATQQVYRYEDGSIYMTAYLSTIIKKENVEKGVKAICEILNELAAKGYIHSCLAPPSSIELVKITKQHESRAVFCFPLVPVDKMEEIKEIAKGLMTTEGEIGKSLESLDMELPEGQFFAEVNISAFQNTDSKPDKVIDTYLNLLPEGTEVISVKKCPIMSLTIPYEVILYNPLMKSIKEVKLNYIRQYATTGNKLKEFNLLTSIEYIKRDGTSLSPA